MTDLDINAELQLAADEDRVELLPDAESTSPSVAELAEQIERQQGSPAEPWQIRQALRRGVSAVVETNGHDIDPEEFNAKMEEPPEDWRHLQRDADGREPIPDPVSIKTLAETHKELRPPIIEGILRQGETVELNAKAKMRKSWTAYAIALCVAAGYWWLGRFRCHQGRVLILDFELHPETLARRIPDVAKAMEIQAHEYEGNIDVLCMRGQLRNIYELWELFDRIEAGTYALVILDALYRVLPPGVSENDNAAMAQVFNAIDRYAKMSGASFLVIHHQTKGDQSGKDVVDVGSGASAFSRSADSKLILRQHELEDHVVLDGVVRSWAPIQPPITLKWTFPVWTVADEVDPALLKGLKGPGDQKQDEKDQKGRETILKCLNSGNLSRRKLREAAGMGSDRLNRLIRQLLDSEDVTETDDGLISKGVV